MVTVTRSVVVGTEPIQLIDYMKNRTTLALFNTSEEWIIYLGSDRTVSIDSGFWFEKLTGLQFNKGLGDRPDLEIWARTAGGVAEVRIWESYAEEGEEET